MPARVSGATNQPIVFSIQRPDTHTCLHLEVLMKSQKNAKLNYGKESR